MTQARDARVREKLGRVILTTFRWMTVDPAAMRVWNASYVTHFTFAVLFSWLPTCKSNQR